MTMYEPYHPERAHEELFKRIQEDIKGINEHILEGARQMERVEASTKSAHKRIDDREEEIKAISSLAHAVKAIAEEMKDIKTLVKTHGDEIAVLKLAPGKIAIKSWALVAGTVATLILGYLFALTTRGGQ